MTPRKATNSRALIRHEKALGPIDPRIKDTFEAMYRRALIAEAKNETLTHQFELQMAALTQRKDAEILVLKNEIANKDAMLLEIKRSTSWKLTHPIRLFGLLYNNPKAFALKLISSLGSLIRKNPTLRIQAHKIYQCLPGNLKRFLTNLNPTPVAGKSPVSNFESIDQKLLDSRIQWILDKMK